MGLADFIQALPKAELHLHLEGAVPWPLVRKYSPDPLPASPPWWQPGYRFPDFSADFAPAVRACYRPVLTAPERYAETAGAIVAGLAEQNVRYVELSFSPNYVLKLGLAVSDIVAAIKSAAHASVAVAVYAGLGRDGAPDLDEAVRAALRAAPGLDGIDLHGDERVDGLGRWTEFFAEARARGLRLKAHAGELAGPASVRAVLDKLGVTRIEHGVRAVEEAALVRRLAAEAITLDVCPTSNVRLNVVGDLSAHPVRRLYAAGVPVTIATDDPTVFGCSLSGELQHLVEQLGFAPADLVPLQRNAFRVAALPAAQQRAIAAELDALERAA